MYRTQYHVVWIPRYRRKILVGGVREYLKKVLLHMEDLADDIEVRKVNIQEDHVHLVLVVPPRLSVASVVQFLKSRTGKKLREKFNFMEKAIYGGRGIWSRGYCVSSIGLDEKKIMKYVAHQEKEDKGQLKLDLNGS